MSVERIANEACGICGGPVFQTPSGTLCDVCGGGVPTVSAKPGAKAAAELEADADGATDHEALELPALIDVVRAANGNASSLALREEVGTDRRDHLMQAHFRLTEALAHLRVALKTRY